MFGTRTRGVVVCDVDVFLFLDVGQCLGHVLEVLGALVSGLDVDQ